MPGRLRRNATEDAIEEPVSSHPRGEEDDVDDAEGDVDMDDEDAPPVASSSRKVTRGKASSKQAVVNATQEDDDNDVDDEPIDVQNFPNQPITRNLGNNLTNIAGDYAVMLDETHRYATGKLANIAGALAEMEGENGVKALKELEGVMQDLIDMEVEMTIQSDVLKDLYQKTTRGEDVTQVKKEWKTAVKAKQDEYNGLTKRKKYAKNRDYQDFKERIYDVQHPGDAMPLLKDLLPKEDGDDESSDEEVEIGGQTQDFKCPLTLKLLDDPLTSKVCKHSYSKTAIYEYLGKNPHEKKGCPASGCAQKISRADLVQEEKLVRRVRDFGRRALRRQQEEADAAKADTLDVDIDDE